MQDHPDDVLLKMIRYALVIFPGLDVLSAFPLNAITLGQNLMSLRYKSGEVQHQSKATVMMFRLAAACPPIVGAIFVSDLGSVNQWVGVFGFTLIFLWPGLLGWAAQRRSIEVFGPRLGKRVPHSTTLSSSRPLFAVLIALGVLL